MTIIKQLAAHYNKVLDLIGSVIQIPIVVIFKIHVIAKL